MLTCPFCHTEVPNGAVVCRGCQAEIDYSRAKEKLYTTLGCAFFGAIILSITMSRFASSETLMVIGAVVFGALGGFCSLKAFKDPTFNRIKKT